MNEGNANLMSTYGDEVESEFTGLKGMLLRYAGCTYALVLVSQFAEALAAASWCPAVLTGALSDASAILFPLAFVAYPLLRAVRALIRP